VFFYTLGAKLGINKIARYAGLTGLGEPTGIDLPHEAMGIVPSEKWKLRNFRQKWYPGETPSVAIGQGALTVTPLQLARALGGVALGGIWHHPHLLKSLDATEEPAVSALTSANVRKVVDGMFGVVNEGGGTGGRARLPGIDVCGKTGSAQLASNDYLQGKLAKRNLKDNAWFEGFAPCHAPEIVVVALFEHGEHGQFAAPIVRDVIKAYFDKKARLSSELQQNQASLTGKSGAEGLLHLPHAVLPAGPAKPAASDSNLVYHEAEEEPEPPEAQQ
jgi:penicillin-binding protein 2